MSIACVICAHRRPLVTEVTLRHLQRQTTLPEVIVVGDSMTERKVAEATGCTYLQHPNRPLGTKWQHGVNFVREKRNVEALMIVGTDDLLTTNWCNVGLTFIRQGYDLVGKNTRYVLRMVKDEPLRLMKKKYPFDSLIGAGRIISSKMLDKLNGQLFKPLDRKLDTFAMQAIKKAGGKIHIFEESDAQVLLLKGDWDCLNRWSITKDSNYVEDIKDIPGWLNAYFKETLDDLKGLMLKS